MDVDIDDGGRGRGRGVRGRWCALWRGRGRDGGYGGGGDAQENRRSSERVAAATASAAAASAAVSSTKTKSKNTRAKKSKATKSQASFVERIKKIIQSEVPGIDDSDVLAVLKDAIAPAKQVSPADFDFDPHFPSVKARTLPLTVDERNHKVFFENAMIRLPEEDSTSCIAQQFKREGKSLVILPAKAAAPAAAPAAAAHHEPVDDEVLAKRDSHPINESAGANASGTSETKSDGKVKIDSTAFLNYMGTKVDSEFVQLAVDLANVKVPAPRAEVGEMFLQQVVYSSIVALFCSFGQERCKADEAVTCPYYVKATEAKGKSGYLRHVSCMPDGAVEFEDVQMVIAMMELKKEGTNDKLLKKDAYKCILLTSMSLLALKQLSDSNNNVTSPIAFSDEIAIPFVMGLHDEAILFATRFDSEKNKIVVERIYTARYNDSRKTDSEEKAIFFATLAVMIARMGQVADSVEKALTRSLNGKREGQFSNAVSITMRRDGDDEDMDDEEAVNEDGGGKPAANETGTAPGSADARENEARMVASCKGAIQDLYYPWPIIETIYLDSDKSDLEIAMELYQQRSPFFFRGVHGSVGVFCKVWREGDPSTYRKHIQQEIALFKRANEESVPTPTVLGELTGLDIERGGDRGTKNHKYHILVTTHEKQDSVSCDGVGRFALSLVRAVMKLHSIGILHCDIKPRNVLWDSQRGTVKLVDFGHAQQTINSKPYESTACYQAPEITRGERHTEKSDAFSVGMVLSDTVDDIPVHATPKRLDNGEIDLVRKVASLLLVESESDRISLDDADAMLSSIHVRKSKKLSPDSSSISKQS